MCWGRQTSLPQIVREGRLKLVGWVDGWTGEWVGGRYFPGFVLPASHPFRWRDNADIGADVVSGYYCYTLRLGAWSLSQLGAHLLAD